MASMSVFKKLTLSTAAAAMVLGVAAPAFAGGGHYRYGHHGHGHYKRHHGHGGGKGAAIALGVIGGAIILSEVSKDRARDRYYQDRYYEDRYYEDRARSRAYDTGYYNGRDDQRRDDARYGDQYDGQYDEDAYYDDSGLEGGEPTYGGPAYDTPDTSYDRAPRVISASAAYQTCLSHARRALSERGFVVVAPYRPDTVEDRGGALLMTATVSAQRGSEQWSRAMSCEASEGRVYRMELI